MKTFDIWNHIQPDQDVMYYDAPACIHAEHRFLYFLLKTAQKGTFPHAERMYVNTNVCTSHAMCVEKTAGEHTFLCLEGPYAGTIVIRDIRSRVRSIPLRALYEKPDLNLPRQATLPPIPEAFRTLHPEENYPFLIVGLLRHLGLTVEEKTFLLNIQSFSAKTRAIYTLLVGLKKTASI